MTLMVMEGKKYLDTRMFSQINNGTTTNLMRNLKNEFNHFYHK